MPTELQLRLNQVEAAEVSAALGLDDAGALFHAYTTAQARVKNETAILEDLKAQIKARIDLGEYVGHETAFATYQTRTTTKFDYKQAMQDGLFNTEQAKPYMTTTETQSLVVKQREEK